MNTPLPTPREIDELVAFLPEFRAYGVEPVDGWSFGQGGADGVVTLPQPKYSQLIERFFEVAGKECWCDYAYRPEEAERMIECEQAIYSASLAQIRTMLTYCVRGERYCDGHWAEMISQGYIRRLLLRLDEIRSIDGSDLHNRPLPESKKSRSKAMKLQKVEFKNLNARQKEIFNFQKISGALADYGFNCMKLADDWQGADFLAYHKDGLETLKVQLKSRLTIDKKYIGKDLFVAFPCNGCWYLLEHDVLIDRVRQDTNWLESVSWLETGRYHSAAPSAHLLKNLSNCKL